MRNNPGSMGLFMMAASMALASAVRDDVRTAGPGPLPKSKARRLPVAKGILFGLPEGPVLHITHEEPLTKRQKRRRRGKGANNG